MITAGAMESLVLSLQSVTQPGDWVVIESPAFYGSLQAIERLKLKAIAIKTDPLFGIDLDALEDIASKYPIKALLANDALSKSIRRNDAANKQKTSGRYP